MPSAPAPFVSFNDYLNANAGSLDQERSSGLAAGTAALGKLDTDVSGALPAAQQQGHDAAQAAWSAQRAGGGVTSSEQYKAPTGFQVDTTKLPGYDQYQQDRSGAETAMNSLNAGGLGLGKTAFEAGMLGADQGYQQKAGELQSKFKDSVNGYLDQINAAGTQGVSSFAPNPIVTYHAGVDPRMAPDEGSTGNMGPTMKPHVTQRKYVNGSDKPSDEEMP